MGRAFLEHIEFIGREDVSLLLYFDHLWRQGFLLTLVVFLQFLGFPPEVVRVFVDMLDDELG